jgi:hypothetical protein
MLMAVGWHRGGATVQRSGRIQAAATPSLIVAAVVAVIGLVVLSIALQPPGGGRIETLEQALAWARAAVFSIGAVTFLVALIALTRGGASAPMTAPFTPYVTERRQPAGGFTLVALGSAPDDTRAITDAPDAGAAVRIMREWTASHPDEHVLVFAPDGEAIAFRRPS